MAKTLKERVLLLPYIFNAIVGFIDTASDVVADRELRHRMYRWPNMVGVFPSTKFVNGISGPLSESDQLWTQRQQANDVT